ncbi:recombination regulator RecX [Salipaludibacillus aurantiacus]|uniref:Regulatory protein RecX n=1 Tax=Salipaludibacillus aurantiacus TaxID=1601833 RepID=A0A1H9SLW1_9BACI|nr:recombination regulator RecX [Salipaludibacillus aurantiacus]SER85931.1 regulatory protein [Salipaludibacillus aurantiacus]
MPIISKITAAKKKKGRFHIYLKREEGEEYAFSVSEDLLVNEHLLKGKELSEEDIERLKEKDDVDKAMQKALNYLSYRMRSEGEITRYLRDQELTEEDIANIIDRLRELQFIDDIRFAEAFVRTKRDTAKKGPLLIEQELYQKGVSQHHIDRAMKEYPEETQLDHAIKMVEKKQSSYKKEGAKKKQQKLMQFVIQRGYPQSVASKAVAEAELETDPEAEWEGLVKHAEKAWRKHVKKDAWERDQKVKQYLFTRGFTAELIDRWFELKKEEG